MLSIYEFLAPPDKGERAKLVWRGGYHFSKEDYFFMKGNEINLTQMLKRREERFNEQRFFLEKFHSPLISFSMNIPGPVKTNDEIFNAFMLGKKLLLNELNNIHAEINNILEVHEDTGDELLLSIKNISSEILKNLTLKIENDYDFGRLYDLDVIDENGKKLSRKNFRKCLICNKQAQECARSRAHSVEEMQNAVEKLLSQIPKREI